MKVATLGELGRLVEGELRGSCDLAITHALPLQSGLPADCITLVDKVGSVDSLEESGAAAAIVPEGFPPTRLSVVECRQPHAAFERIIEHLRPVNVKSTQGVHHAAHVDPTSIVGVGCTIAAGVTIGPGAVIGARVRLHPGVHVGAHCQIGSDSELYPGVVLYEGTRVGSRCLIHAGTVLGAFGFGYRSSAGKHQRSAQLGWVELGDDVELGACVTIDRGTYGPTRIGEGTKIDNQVMIGHNCQIGKHNLICAHVGIAGSCSTGDYVVLAGQVGLKDHVHLADRVVVTAQGGVMHNIPEGEVWGGSPAIPARKYMQSAALVARLPEMRSDLRRLETATEKMQQELEAMHKLIALAQSMPAQDASRSDQPVAPDSLRAA